MDLFLSVREHRGDLFLTIHTKYIYIMAKTLEILRKVANVPLCIGVFAVFNESDTFVPNFIGLACAALLVIINRERGAR